MENELKVFTEGKVVVGEREFTRLMGGFGDGKPCISDKQIADLLDYKMGARQVRQQVERNIKHFEYGCDLVDLQREDISDPIYNTLISLGYAKQSITQAENIYLLSHEGFLLYLQITNVNKDYAQFEKQYFGYNSLKIVNPMRYELGFGVLLHDLFNDICKFNLQHSCCNNQYRIDFYEPSLKLAIEYDEEHHTNKINYINDSLRQSTIENELKCHFIRIKKGQELNGIKRIFAYILNKNNKLIKEVI